MEEKIYKEAFDRVEKVMTIFSKNHPEFNKEINHLFTHNFNVLSIEVGKQRVNFGCCKHQKNYFGFDHKAIYGSKITYNKRLLEKCEENLFLNTIVHEIFHSCAENMNTKHQGHKGFWKELAEIYNEIFPQDQPISRCSNWSNEPTTKEEIVEVNSRPYRYAVICEKCGATKYYKIKGKVIKNINNYRCNHCGSTLYVEEL